MSQARQGGWFVPGFDSERGNEALGPQPGLIEIVQGEVDLLANTPRADAQAPADEPVPSSVPGPRQGLIHGPPTSPVRGPRTALVWVAITLTLHLILDQVLGGSSMGTIRGVWRPDPNAGVVQGWLWTLLDHPFRSAVGLTALLWALRPRFGPLGTATPALEATGADDR